MLWLLREGFPTLDFHDPDDAMRLLEVRDWINGQSFYDVSQHRVNPPIGGPMHWSRIVDLPIALLFLIAHSFTSAKNAEIFACVVTPLLLLGCLTVALHAVAKRIGGSFVALISVIMMLTAPSITLQLSPLRIDHHGWQILMAVVALWGAIDPRPARGGMITGSAIALWLQISSEGLPYAALFGALFALRFWISQGETSRFLAFAITLGGGGLTLLIVLRGPQATLLSQCDALSAVYIWPLITLAIAAPSVLRITGATSMKRRLLAGMAAGGAAIAIFTFTGGTCLSGNPFQTLSPEIYRMWYLRVLEGLPIWHQNLVMAGIIALPCIVGLIGTLMAAYYEAKPSHWPSMALLLIGTSCIAIFVMRAMSVAHVFAFPGMAWLLLRLFHKIDRLHFTPARIFGLSLLSLLTPAGLSIAWLAATVHSQDRVPVQVDCSAPSQLEPLDHLAPATLFAPLDIGPAILVRTKHNIIGTGHHRNAVGIAAVINGFTAPPAQAHALIAGLNGGKGADYVVTCAGLDEMDIYIQENAQGLAATLNRGTMPDWLQPLPTKGALRVYRVIDPSGRKARATPFMQ